MVKVETVLFGEIEIRDDQIIRFPGGIPGFEDHEKFTIIEPDPSVPFSYLQSIEDQELHFILADPFVFFLKAMNLRFLEVFKRRLRLTARRFWPLNPLFRFKINWRRRRPICLLPS